MNPHPTVHGPAAPKTVVIGAGVVGLSCAYELSELGHQVTVLECGSAGAAASAGNAGWVTPFLSTPRAAPGAVKQALQSFVHRDGPARMRPHVELGYATWILKFLLAARTKPSGRATRALQELSREALGSFDSLESRGVEFEHHKTGLGVAFKKLSNLEHYEVLQAKMRALGYQGNIRTYRGVDVRSFDPALGSQVTGVMHLESERHVRPESLTRGLTSAVQRNGGVLVEHQPVAHLRMHTSGKWVVTTASQEYLADHVLVAAGHHTRELLRPLRVNIPLEAAKGTSMTARGTGTVPVHPLKLYESMVACSPFGDEVRLSGTYDVGMRDFNLNSQRLQAVVQQGQSFLHDWEPTDVRVEWVGHRPTTPDDLPIIGPVKSHPGLYVATGHGTLGLTLGPLTGVLAAREIAQQDTQPLLRPFRLERFDSLIPRSS